MAGETVATIRVIEDRDDSGCYEEALRRVEALGKNRPEVVSLAAAMFQLSERRTSEKKRRRKRP
jgi:hypothetical protein